MRRVLVIVCVVCLRISLVAQPAYRIEDIINDVYEQIVETGEADYHELQEELMGLAANPINLNAASADDLAQLRFLNENQIDAILLYVHQHPMQSIGELDLIAELQPYEIRNLKAFVTVSAVPKDTKLYGKEVFHYGKNELLTRVDARNIENYSGDPMYAKMKYRFNYQNRVQFGVQLQRMPGSAAADMQYGGYIDIRDMGVCQSVVVGNYQAQFGQGLVLSNPYHQGKSNYVTTVGMQPEGLKKYSSADGEGLHGVGTTLHFQPTIKGEQKLHIHTSVLYSVAKEKDTTFCHTLGANVDFRYNRWKIGATYVENIRSATQYQAVVGVNFRYNHGWVDVFGEVAAAQAEQWGVGVQVGSRFTPIQNIGLLLLYRYYSPSFQNELGYGFSETTHINDENGLYLGADIQRLAHWRFTAYADVFRFSQPKHGIPYAPSFGYDTRGEAIYYRSDWNMQLRFRAREKAKKSTYALRYQFNWEQGGWKLRTQADANLVQDSLGQLTWGVSVHQDIQYSFTIPLALQFRAQAFDARQWDNRIYIYENDVLYASSTPATYGCGGYFYLNLRWQIIDQLALYLKVSETVYERSWAYAHDRQPTRTDIHLQFRATF